MVRLARFPPTTDLNPYQRLLYGYLSAHGVELVPDGRLGARWLWSARREVTHLHFHWRLDRHYRTPGSLAWPRGAAFVGRLLLARALGLRLVWTIHEVGPRERRERVDLWVYRMLMRLSDARMAHDEATASRARAVLGRAAADIEVVPHGSYVDVYPEGRPRAAVRAELGIPDRAFAFLVFGTLDRYKRVEEALEAFAALDRHDVALVVAGQVRNEGSARAVREAALADRRIVPRFGYVPDERVRELFGACDAAILAREDGGTSGSLILAMSMGLPTVAADRPTYREVLGAESAGWLFEPGDPSSLAAALEAAADDSVAARAKGAAAYERAAELRWPDAASRTAAVLARAAG